MTDPKAPAPSLADALYRDRARAALAEYDARKAAGEARTNPMLYPELAGLLSEALRAYLAADNG